MMPGAVEVVEARLRVSQPQTLPEQSFGVSLRGESGAVVPHLDDEELAPQSRANFDLAGAGARGDGVADGVLDDGLQDEVRDAHVERFGVNLDARREAVLKTYPLDLQVTMQELHLLIQRDLLRAGVLQRQAQEVAEARDHRAGRLSVLVEQGRDGVERVEEEVRVELHLQSLKLRLRELCLKLRGAQLALAVAPVVTEDLIE